MLRGLANAIIVEVVATCEAPEYLLNWQVRSKDTDLAAGADHHNKIDEFSQENTADFVICGAGVVGFVQCAAHHILNTEGTNT